MNCPPQTVVPTVDLIASFKFRQRTESNGLDNKRQGDGNGASEQDSPDRMDALVWEGHVSISPELDERDCDPVEC